MSKKKHFERFDLEFNSDCHGKEFISSSGQESHQSFNILYCSVDTVKQLYTLIPDESFMLSLDDALESDNHDDRYINFHGEQWKLGRGGKSGYRYLLQNAELGLILLVKSNYTKADLEGSHLKIEVSPHLIADKTPAHLQATMDELALNIASNGKMEPKACAVHPAIDFQGWEPPIGFNEKLTCRSRRITDRHGVSQLYLDNDICSVHGKGQSYLFGSATTMQMALYNKTLEAKHSDKIGYMELCWGQKTVSFDEKLYNPELPVWRLELRFSHSVIDQFSEMNMDKSRERESSLHDQKIRTYEQVSQHLSGLVEYGLNNFRYDYNSRYIHPVWTMLLQDNDFDAYQPGFVYRRKYKQAGVGNEKNVAIALGNMLSIYARHKFTSQQALDMIKESGIYLDVVGYFRSRGLEKSDIKKFIESGLIKRQLASKLAA